MFRTKMWFLEIMEMYKDPRSTDKHIKTENTKQKNSKNKIEKQFSKAQKRLPNK